MISFIVWWTVVGFSGGVGREEVNLDLGCSIV